MQADGTSNANELDLADDIEASGYFNLHVLNNGVYARVTQPLQNDTSALAPRCNLFAISNTFGWAVAATPTGFSLFSLAELRSLILSSKQRTTPDLKPNTTVEVGEGGLTFLRVASGDKVIVASGPALRGGIGLWRLKDLVDGSDTKPFYTFTEPSKTPLLDILPNPSDRPELVALLNQDGKVQILNLDMKAIVATFGDHLTSACWSVKGKQLVCGDGEGRLVQYTPEGVVKSITPAPPSVVGTGSSIVDIRWVENSVFFVTYMDLMNPLDGQLFAITRQKDGRIDYAPIPDPLMVENSDRPEYRMNAWLKGWAPFKHLLLVCNSTSNTIGHVAQAPSEEGGDNIVWSQVKNDLFTTLPLDSYPLGLEVDLTATDAPSPEENAGDIATPLLWSLGSDGTISGWRIINKQGGQYPALAAPRDITTQGDLGSAETQPQAVPMSGTATPAPLAPSASPLAAPSATPPAFSTPAFGSSSFSSTPSFGSSSTLSKSGPFAPAFGQGSSFGSSSPAHSFGQSSFGKAASGSSASGFGNATVKPVSSGGGFASFGSGGSVPSGFAAASPTAAGSPFGSAQSTRPSTPAFASDKPTTFGASSFGQPAASTSGFGFAANTGEACKTASTFPSASSSAKGSANESSAFGTNTFGSLSSTSPFSTPTTKLASNAFGSFATDNSKPSTSSITAKPLASAFSLPGAASTSTSHNFGGLRDAGGDPSDSDIHTASKPPGLDDAEAEHLEPTATNQQLPSTFGFGGSSTGAEKLSFGGLSFGANTASDTASATKFTNPSFGASHFGSDNAKDNTGVKKGSEASDTSGPEPKPASPFSGLGPQSEGFASTNTTETKSAFGFSAFGQSSNNGDAKKADKKPINAFSFTNPEQKTRADQTGTGQEKPAAFGFSGFGQTAKLGSAFDNASPFSASSSTPSKPATTSAFSSFATPSSTPGSSSPFAAAASGSTTPSKSPTPFGQPGFFSGFSKPNDTSSTKSMARQTSLSDKEPSAPEETSKIEELDSDHGDLAQEQSESDLTEEPEVGENSETDEQEQELLDYEGGKGEGSQDSRNEEEEYVDEEAGDEDEYEVEDSDRENGEDLSSDHDSQEANVTNATEADVTPSVDLTASSAAPDSPTLFATAKPDLKSENSSRSGPSPFAGFESPKARAAQSADSEKSNKPVFSFAPVTASIPQKSETERVPETTLGEPASSDDKNLSSPFANFGKVTPSSTFTSQNGVNKAKSAPTFSFAQPQSKSTEPPKPFGFSNLNKATPRTSSPLASKPSFAPPSPAKSDVSGFPSANLTSEAKQESRDDSTAVKAAASTDSSLPFFGVPAKVSSPSAYQPQLHAPQPQAPVKTATLETSTKTIVPASISEGIPPVAPPKLTNAISKSHAPPGEVSVFTDMQSQLVALNDSTLECVRYMQHVQTPRLPPKDSNQDLDALDFAGDEWSMGDISRLTDVAEALKEITQDISMKSSLQERNAKDIESSLLKVKAKTEAIARYIKAKEDPAMAKLMKVRQLGPEQLENQKNIRHLNQNVNEAIDELEKAIAGLKSKILDKKLGRSPMKAPSLDSIHRAIRNITTVITQKNLELSDLTLRLDMATLSTSASSPGRHFRSIDEGQTSIIATTGSSTDLSAITRRGRRSNDNFSSSTQKRVQRLLEAEVFGQRLKEAWLANGRSEPLLGVVSRD